MGPNRQRLTKNGQLLLLMLLMLLQWRWFLLLLLGLVLKNVARGPDELTGKQRRVGHRGKFRERASVGAFPLGPVQTNTNWTN